MQIAVRVFPRSRQNALEWGQHSFKARLTAPPVDGAANEALVALLAERLDIPSSSHLSYGTGFNYLLILI